MKILSIVGSPRINGNTHFLAQKFCEGAASIGAEIEEVLLGRLNVGPCIHCDKCIEAGVCGIQDDCAEIISKMREADALLYSSPVYCWSVTGQMKCFMDRCHSMSYPTWESTGVVGKPVFFIVGAGYPPREDPSFVIHHKIRADYFLRWIRNTKLSIQNKSIRDAIDPMVPFDPCIGAITLLYQYAVILGMEPIGSIGAEGLGHNRKAIRSREEDIQHAVMSGVKFTGMTKMILENAYM